MSRMGTRWHPRYTDVLKPWCNTIADDVSRCRRERNDHEGSAASHPPRSGQSGASDLHGCTDAFSGCRKRPAGGASSCARNRRRARSRSGLSQCAAGEDEPNGEPYAETVLLRLITERGRPSVKIGASEQAAGISLTGPSNTKQTWVILEAKGTATSLRLKNEDGREQIVAP